MQEGGIGIPMGNRSKIRAKGSAAGAAGRGFHKVPLPERLIGSVPTLKCKARKASMK